jgi:N-acetylglutamate synthase-like GNAT family acetyltransferase
MTSGVNTSHLSQAYTTELAQEQDLEAIKRLLRQAHFDTRQLYVKNFMLVRTADGSVIGCGQIKTVGQSRVLSSVVIGANWRKRGMGRVLVSALLTREPGPVILMCVGRLIPYYESYGFQVVSARRAPFDIFWRWLVLRIVGPILPGWENGAIMERPEPRGS